MKKTVFLKSIPKKSIIPKNLRQSRKDDNFYEKFFYLHY